MANVSVLNTTSQLSGKTIAVCENDQTISGAWTFSGNQSFTGNVTVGNAVGDTLSVNSTIVSNLIFTDATYDIGASGATRPRDFFLSRNATIGGTLGVTGVATFTAVPVFNGTGATTFNGDLIIVGTTPLLTIGDAGEEDAGILFDGNAQDYYVALDDSADQLVIGLGAVIGTTPIIQLSADGSATWTSSTSSQEIWKFNGTAAGNTGIAIQRSGTSKARWYYDGTNVNFVAVDTPLLLQGVGSSNITVQLSNVGVDNFGPTVNNVLSLGKAGNRWTEVFAVNGTINTSDEREKNVVEGALPGLSFINALNPFAYRWKASKPGVVDNRIHYGLGARATGAITPIEAALVSRDDESGWGMNYGELIAPVIKAIQELHSDHRSTLLRGDDHERRIKELTEKVEKLETN